MAKKTAPLLPSTEKLLHQFGERLRLARLRRRLPAKHVAARAGMSPITLRSLERGGAGVTLGAYLAVMQVLGIEGDLDLLGQADPLGRELQDARMPARRKLAASVTRRSLSSTALKRDKTYRQFHEKPLVQVRQALDGGLVARADHPANRINKILNPASETKAWIDKGGFSSSQVLAQMIVRDAPVNRKRKKR